MLRSSKLLWAVLLALCLCSVGYAEPSEIVLKTLAMEADGDASQTAVAGVIISRSMASGKSLEAVCLAPKQFSCWNDGKWSRAWLTRYYTPKARQRAEMALKQASYEASKGRNPGYTHYHAYNVNQWEVEVKPYWARGVKGVRIGNHVFYRGIK